MRRLASTTTLQTNNTFLDEETIAHHGILGQKWGIRRFQNKDGSLKPAGKKRYNNGEGEEERDTGLGSGAQNNSSKRKGLGKIAAFAGGAALAAASVGPTMEALGKGKTHYSKMDTEDLANENRRAKLESVYKKNHGIKDSPQEVLDEASKGIDAIRKYRDADQPQYNPNQNRYNTRRTMSQKEMDSMSDQDLQKLVNRMNLETQYSRLTSDPPARSKVDIGLDRTQAVMTIIGSAVTVGAAAYSIHSKFRGRKQ